MTSTVDNDQDLARGNIAFVLKPTRRVRRELMPLLQSWLAEAHFSRAELLVSERAGHALDLAAEAGAWADTVIAVGGDGTLNEVANGLARAGSADGVRKTPVLGLLAGGTANDFARGVGLATEPRAALAQLRGLLEASAPMGIDAGLLHCVDGQGEPVTRFFINVADVGLGAEVVRGVNRGKRRLGAHLTYLRAILAAFARHRPARVRVEIDGATVYRGRLLIGVVGNGRFLGSGLQALPSACVDDGCFELLIAGEVLVFTFLTRLPALRRGERIDHPQAHYHRGREIVITAEQGECGVETDGEFLGRPPVQISLHDSAFRFLLPISAASGP